MGLRAALPVANIAFGLPMTGIAGEAAPRIETPGGGPAGRFDCLRETLLVALHGAEEGGLGGGERRHRDPERRAGNVVEADLVAEPDRHRVAAVLAADATFRSGRVLQAELLTAMSISLTTTGSSDWKGLYGRILSSTYLANPRLRVVAAVAERHLGQVVGAKLKN